MPEPASPATGAAAAPTRLVFRRLDEVLGDAREEPEWIVEGLVACQAITLIGGQPKAGKTSLLFGMASASQNGERFAGRPTRQASMVLLSEERPQSLWQRAGQFGFPAASAECLLFHEARDVPWPVLVRRAAERCLKWERGMLVVDTWGRWVRLRGDDENQAGAVDATLEPLLEAAGQGLAVVLLHHQRKSGGDYGTGLRGSNALGGGVDIIAELDRYGQNKRQRLLRVLSRFGTGEDELVLELDEHNRYRTLGTRGDLAAQQREQQVLDWLIESGGGTEREAVDALGISVSKANRLLKKLALEKRVSRSGNGKRNSPFHYTVVDTAPSDPSSAKE